MNCFVVFLGDVLWFDVDIFVEMCVDVFIKFCDVGKCVFEVGL